MPSIVICLSPEDLSNPDADLRYLLPDMLAEKSGGLVEDDGLDYSVKTGRMFSFCILPIWSVRSKRLSNF